MRKDVFSYPLGNSHMRWFSSLFSLNGHEGRDTGHPCMGPCIWIIFLDTHSRVITSLNLTYHPTTLLQDESGTGSCVILERLMSITFHRKYLFPCLSPQTAPQEDRGPIQLTPVLLTHNTQ